MPVSCHFQGCKALLHIVDVKAFFTFFFIQGTFFNVFFYFANVFLFKKTFIENTI